MPASPDIALAKIRRDFGYRISPHTCGASATTSTAAFLRLGEHRPYLSHSGSASGQHAVLHAVQVAAVDRWHEAAGH